MLILDAINFAYLAFGETFAFVLCHLLVLWRVGVNLPFFATQVVPSKMKLDDLIRTSLMVMAVARAGEQQSVIRWVWILQLQCVCKIQYRVERSLNCQRSRASARGVLMKVNVQLVFTLPNENTHNTQ